MPRSARMRAAFELPVAAPAAPAAEDGADREWISALTAAREIGCHERTVSSWRLKGWLEGKKDPSDSRRWLYLRGSVKAANARAALTANGPGVVKRGKPLSTSRAHPARPGRGD